MEEELQLGDFIRALWRQKWWMMLFTISVMGAALWVSKITPPAYRASAVLVPPETDVAWPTPDGLKTRFGAASVGGAIKPGVTATDVLMGMLKSRRLALAVIEKFDLRYVYPKEPKLITLPPMPWQKPGEGPLLSDILEKLQKRTDIRMTKEGLLSLGVEDMDPKRAAAMVAFYLEELTRANMELMTTYNQYLTRVLDAPIVPDKPSHPRPVLNTALGGAVAMFAWIVGCILHLSLQTVPVPASKKIVPLKRSVSSALQEAESHSARSAPST